MKVGSIYSTLPIGPSVPYQLRVRVSGTNHPFGFVPGGKLSYGNLLLRFRSRVGPCLLRVKSLYYLNCWYGWSINCCRTLGANLVRVHGYVPRSDPELTMSGFLEFVAVSLCDASYGVREYSAWLELHKSRFRALNTIQVSVPKEEPVNIHQYLKMVRSRNWCDYGLMVCSKPGPPTPPPGSYPPIRHAVAPARATPAAWKLLLIVGKLNIVVPRSKTQIELWVSESTRRLDPLPVFSDQPLAPPPAPPGYSYLLVPDIVEGASSHYELSPPKLTSFSFDHVVTDRPHECPVCTPTPYIPPSLSGGMRRPGAHS